MLHLAEMMEYEDDFDDLNEKFDEDKRKRNKE
jgi:hypothetical protein